MKIEYGGVVLNAENNGTQTPEKTRGKSAEEKARIRSEKREENKRNRRNKKIYKKDITKQYRKIKLKRVRTYALGTLATLFVALIIGVTVGGYYVYSNYWGMVDEAYTGSKEAIDNLDLGVFTEREPTIIYDKADNVLTELAQHEFEYVKIEDMQDNIKLAAIAVEDERYLEHDGVDLKAISRAAVELVRNKGQIKQGGSTITQQLVKNSLLTFDQTYSRKLSEVFMAYELEKKLSKKQILEYYLNNIYFGSGAYGIESASNYYFSKPSSDLTLAEATYLMTFPNNPSLYDPIKHPENVVKRQSRILQKMYAQNFITKEEFTEASLAEVTLDIHKRNYTPETYLVSYAISDATKKLMKTDGFKFKYKFETEDESKEYTDSYNETFTKFNQAIRKGGFIIKTSLDQKMQDKVQTQVNSVMSYSTAKNGETGLYKRQASTVVLDNETGLVNAIVGGRTQTDVANTYNRAYLARRQPGSTIKPLLVYTQMFESKYTKDSQVVDEPVKKGPRNVTGKYVGVTTVEKAVKESINTIPFRYIQELGVDKSLDYLRDMQFTGIVDTDINPTVAIGGFTYGATVLEMASAYSTLERNGEYIEPTAIVSIAKASNGELIYTNKPEKKRVYDAGAAWMMTDVLTRVAENTNFSDGRNGKLEGYATAVKTGTTNNVKDVWYAGYTPYYTTVVWVGEDTPKEMSGKTSYDDPMDIWLGVMKSVNQSKPHKTTFDKPVDALKTVWVKNSNGRLSATARSGWRKAEVPLSRWNKQVETDKKAEEERQLKLAEERKKAEAKAEADRVERERIVLEKKKAEEELDKFLSGKGTSLNAEKTKREKAESAIKSIMYSTIQYESQFGLFEGYLEDTQALIEDIVYIEYKEELQAKLQEQILRIDNQKDLILRDGVYAEYRKEQAINREKENAIKAQERQRLQEQLAIKAEEEAKLLEEEKKKQDALDKQFEMDKLTGADQSGTNSTGVENGSTSGE